MDTDNIESIHQLPAGRIGGMVAVGKTVFIDHDTSL